MNKCKYCGMTIFWARRGTGSVPYEDAAGKRHHDCEKAPWKGGEAPAHVPSPPPIGSPELTMRIAKLECNLVDLRREFEALKALVSSIANSRGREPLKHQGAAA